MSNSMSLNSDVRSNSLQEEPHLWIKGVNQGSPYKIPMEARGNVAQKIMQDTVAVKKKAQIWIQESIETGTDINKIASALIWTINDVAAVACDHHQFNLINLQRENVLWKVHCCHIIRKVTKNVMKKAVVLAQSRVNRSDPYQVIELNRICAHFLKWYSDSKNPCEKDIEREEEKSFKIRQAFFKQVSFLLTDLSGYKSHAIREKAKVSIEFTCQQILSFNEGPDKTRGMIDELFREAIEAINGIECVQPEQVFRECETIVGQVSRFAMDIILPYHIHWKSGNCHTE